jgi:Zn-dependent protease with chaperone function
MSEDRKIQINTATDRANYLLNGIAALGTLAVIATQAGAGVAVGALAFSCYLNTTQYAVANKAIGKFFPTARRSQLPRGSEGLPEVVVQMSEKLGLKPPRMSVVDEDQNEGLSKNAAAYGLKTHGLLAGKALLEDLDDRLEPAVMTHELAHMKAKHQKRKLVMDTIDFATRGAGFINYALTLANPVGVGTVVLGIGAGTVAGGVLNGLAGHPDNKETQAAIDKVSRKVQRGTILATSLLLGQYQVVAAWGLAKAMTTVSGLAELRQERCDEYQADRIAGELTGKPRDLACALRDIRDSQIRAQCKSGTTETFEKESKTADKLEALFEIVSSHPTTSKRCQRLEQMALKMENREPVPA